MCFIPALKRKCRHYKNSFTSCTESCRFFNNFRYSGENFAKVTTFRFSVYTDHAGKPVYSHVRHAVAQKNSWKNDEAHKAF